MNLNTCASFSPDLGKETDTTKILSTLRILVVK